MSALIAEYPPLLIPDATAIDDPQNTIRNAAPVGAEEWLRMGQAVTWLRGSGRQLVSGATGEDTFGGSATSPIVFRHYVVGNEHLNDPVGRVWMITLLPTVDFTQFTITFQITLKAYTAVTGVAGVPKTFVFIEVPGDVYPSPPVIGYNIAWSSGGVRHLTTCCSEIPLNVLQADDGPDLATLLRNDPIFEHSTDLVSHGGVFSFITLGKTRRTIFSDYVNDGLSSTDTAFDGTSNVYALDPAVQARKILSGDTARTVDWAAQVQGTGGDGEIRLTSAAGSNTQSFSTSRVWVTGTLSIETDDPSRYGTDGGIRGGTRDSIVVEIRRTTATSVSFFGLVIGDA